MIMPPDLDYFPGLFLPDLERARLAGRLALLAERLRSRGHGVRFDLGGQGLTAIETARALRDEGVRRIVLVGAKNDRVKISILSEALKQSGLDPGRPFITKQEGVDIHRPLANRIESLAKMDLYLKDDPTLGATDSCLMILEHGEAQPRAGVQFRRKEGRLYRLTEGRYGSIPAAVKEIRFFPMDGMVPDWIDSEDALTALVIKDSTSLEPYHLDDWASLLDGPMKDRFRLFVEEPGPGHPPACGGAAWAVRYGIDRPDLRDLIQRIVTRFFPAQLPLFRILCGIYEVGADPLEEMYAGNSLADRNAELIKLIVP
jgi:hypothetical protein